MRIGVCDDHEDIADDWVAKIKDVVDTANVAVSRMGEAKGEVSKLIQRKLRVEEGKNPLDQETEFDNLDILVVDYDLLHLDEGGGRTTGEGIARLARLYSKCGAIVVINQFKGPQFDLGMRGHLDSHADVNVDAGLIGCSTLWAKGPAAESFNPTTWTPLPDLLGAAHGLTKNLSSEDMGKPLMPIMGLEEAALAELSDTAFGFLDSKAETAEQLASVTVRQFLERSIDGKIVDCLSKHALELLHNFAAFRVVKWLDRAVLRPMDILVDTPHLIDRLPFLIDPNKTDMMSPDAWTKAASKPKDKLYWDILHQFHNKKASAALGKVMFDWYRITRDERIDDQQDEYLENPSSRFYLAEDTSRFVKKEDLIRYRADFHNFGDRRAIEKLDGISYGPLRRIHFG